MVKRNCGSFNESSTLSAPPILGLWYNGITLDFDSKDTCPIQVRPANYTR